VGLVGSFGAFPILVWHLYTNEPAVFGTVIITGIAVFAIEMLYFGRDTVWSGVERGGRGIADFAADRRSNSEEGTTGEATEG
jgi:hypothetical protein